MATAQATYIATDTATLNKATKPQIPLLARFRNQRSATHTADQTAEICHINPRPPTSLNSYRKSLAPPPPWGAAIYIHGAFQPAIRILPLWNFTPLTLSPS